MVIIRATSFERSCGTSPRNFVSGSGNSSKCALNLLTKLSEVNGGFPLRGKCNLQPRLEISVYNLASLPPISDEASRRISPSVSNRVCFVVDLYVGSTFYPRQEERKPVKQQATGVFFCSGPAVLAAQDSRAQISGPKTHRSQKNSHVTSSRKNYSPAVREVR